MPLADGHQSHLYRCEPHRKRARVMLDQHAEKSLDRSEQRAMHHHRLMTSAVLAHILQLKARGQVEVKLHGRKLPQASQNVDELHVDLGAVECRLAREGLEGEPAFCEHFFQ